MAQEKSRERAEKLIKQMTEEEKLRLCLGKTVGISAGSNG